MEFPIINIRHLGLCRSLKYQNFQEALGEKRGRVDMVGGVGITTMAEEATMYL